MLKPTLLLLMLLPVVAAAQEAPPSESSPAAHSWKTDAQGNAMFSREDTAIAFPRLAERFDEIDADKDGYLSRGEIRAWHQATHQGMGMKDEAMHKKDMKRMKQKAADRFKEADKNGDGVLSRDEAQAMPRIGKDFDAVDANQDGQVTRDEIRAHSKAQVQQRRDKMARMQEEAAANFKQADKNGDGMLSKEEAQAMPRVAQNFDAIDANKDGQATHDEIRAFMRGKSKRGGTGKVAPAKP
ncbi:MAG: EF-hand domain-containing protein [Pseudomonadota bacterium]